MASHGLPPSFRGDQLPRILQGIFLTYLDAYPILSPSEPVDHLKTLEAFPLRHAQGSNRPSLLPDGSDDCWKIGAKLLDSWMSGSMTLNADPTAGAGLLEISVMAA